MTPSFSLADAKPRKSAVASGDDLGIGASFALNIVDVNTRTEVENTVAFKTEAGKSLGHVTLDADSAHVMVTEAAAGGASKSGTAIGGAVAVAFGEHNTLARLGDGTALAMSGDLAAPEALLRRRLHMQGSFVLALKLHLILG